MFCIWLPKHLYKRINTILPYILVLIILDILILYLALLLYSY